MFGSTDISFLLLFPGDVDCTCSLSDSECDRDFGGVKVCVPLSQLTGRRLDGLMGSNHRGYYHAMQVPRVFSGVENRPRGGVRNPGTGTNEKPGRETGGVKSDAGVDLRLVCDGKACCIPNNELHHTPVFGPCVI